MAILLVSALQTWGQADARAARERLESAKKLYNIGMYVSAEKEFDAIAADVEDKTSLFYAELMANKTLCAIALERDDMEGLAKNFENSFPYDPQVGMIKFRLGVSRFDHGKYDEALKIFTQIDEDNLFKTVRPEYNFKRGYCHMRVGAYDDALGRFRSVIKEPVGQYYYPSIYYSGYVRYLLKDFGHAAELFDKSAKDNRFTVLAGYYGTECRFMQKDYDYVVKNGPALYQKLDQEMKPSLARIMSESYYALEKPSEARKYLDLYMSSGKNISRKDRYFSGIVSYSLGDYENAINSFEKVVGAADSLGQSAWYYSANSYLKSRNKIAAMEAFRKASELNFDQVVREDAFFNYAKLAFDVNRDISQFEKYVKEYPRSGKDDIINTYVSTAYLLNGEYDSAIEAMKKIKYPSRDVKGNMQKANLLRGVDLADVGSYSAAVPYLESAASSSANLQASRAAKYWLAECYYRGSRFDDAKKAGNQLLDDPIFRSTAEYPVMLYNMGYSYLKSDDWQNAASYFSKYLGNARSDGKYDRDARLRLGDSYYMMGRYNDAKEQYLEVRKREDLPADMYPEYQAAMASGLAGDENIKLSILQEAVNSKPNAQLYPNALYELGRLYVQKDRTAPATECFNRLLGVTDSSFHPKALLELAMINSNASHYSKAIECYDNIIRNYPMSSEVQEALAGMESVYQIQNRPEDFIAYLDKIGIPNARTAGEKETMLFNSAEQIFLSGNYSSAVNALQTFLSSYPKGVRSGLANYYLGESLKATGRKEAASDAYYKSMSLAEGPTARAATASYADINYELGRYSKALEAYESLAFIADSGKERKRAAIGKMMSCYKLRRYPQALRECDRVLSLDEITAEEGRQSRYVAMKCHLVNGDRDLAKTIMAELSENPIDEFGAEAAYLTIQGFYDAGNFTEVENKVYAFSDSGTPQLYWLAKSFIILGDSFADRDDWEQARATYESIRDGYAAKEKSDDVPQQVRLRLDKLKKMGK